MADHIKSIKLTWSQYEYMHLYIIPCLLIHLCVVLAWFHVKTDINHMLEKLVLSSVSGTG